MPILSLITFTPLVGALLLLFIPKDKIKAIHAVAIGATILSFLFSLHALAHFNPGSMQMDSLVMQFEEKFSWIPSFNIQYYMGVDGLSLPLILLTTLLSILAGVYSMNITNR